MRENIARIADALERIADALDLLVPDPDVDQEISCSHPAEQLEDHSTLGDERYHCRACGADFTQDPRSTTSED